MLLGPGVVLLPVNLAALCVLLMLHLAVLLRRQLAAVRRAIVAHLSVDPRFVALDVRSFTPRQLPGLHSVADALLLANLARVHAHPFRMKRTAVVLRHPVAAVLAGEALMRNLFRSALHMPFAQDYSQIDKSPRNG